MTRHSFFVLGAGLLALAAPSAWAQTQVNARVLSATPMVQNVPVTQCAPARWGQPTGGGAAVGALVGGLAGSQLGSGSGHIVGAILGTLGGAFVGNAVEAQQTGYGGCQTAYQQQITGYDVRYELGGRTYQTQMAQAPGAWIQVPVASGYGQGPAPDTMYDSEPVQTYPVAPSVAGVVTAPQGPAVQYAPGYVPGYAPAYPAAYPAYTQPVGTPVYVRPAPVYVAPVGVNLSVGGGWGHGWRGGGWGVSVGNAW